MADLGIGRVGCCLGQHLSFDREYTPTRLGNWEVPRWAPSRARHAEDRAGAGAGASAPLADSNGWLLPSVPRSKSGLFGLHVGTWEMPRKITRAVANELSKQPPDGRFRSWLRHQAGGGRAKAAWCEEGSKGGDGRAKAAGREEASGGSIVGETAVARGGAEVTRAKAVAVDNEGIPTVRPEEQITDELPRALPVDEDGNGPYIPGSLTDPDKRHPSYGVLVKQAVEDLHGPQENDEDKFWRKVAESGERNYEQINEQEDESSIQNMRGKYGRHSKQDKPKSGTILPKVPTPGYFYARKMHMDNLLHQPLPDTLVYRYLQQKGNELSDSDLVVKPYAVAWKGYGASGPTGCTKMRVHRPKTSCPKHDKDKENKVSRRPATSGQEHGRRNQKPLSQMDLAICWDFRPIDRKLEPKRPTHIDGSNGSKGPAVFTMVQTPKEEIELPPVPSHSNPIFTQSHAADDMGPHTVPYFEKDMSKTPHKDTCDVQNCPKHENQQNQVRKTGERVSRSINSEPSSRRTSALQSTNSVEPKKCDGVHGCGTQSDISSDLRKHFSRPEKLKPIKEAWSNNKSVDKNIMHGGDMNNNYCKPVNSRSNSIKNINKQRNSIESYDKTSLAQGKLHQSSPDVSVLHSSGKGSSDHKTSHKSKYCNTCKDHNNPQSQEKSKIEFKSAFKAGNPNSVTSGSDYHSGAPNSNGIRVPKMRDPYAKRTYTIPTLAPPFCLWREKSNSGYPEHWRLASVYQHAYKPPDQRRKPLMAGVYK